jgi:hypothetical protein
VKSDGIVFGSWYKCDDGKAHYLLGTSALCGTDSEPVREVYGTIALGPTFPGQTLCGRCRLANARRWEKAYPSPVPMEYSTGGSN